MSNRIFNVFACLFLLFISHLSFAKTLNASVDRNNVQQNETFLLKITMEGQQTDAHLNLKTLKDNFDILTTSQSSQVSIIDGKAQSKTQWMIQLTPRKTGELTIPQLSLGDLKTDVINIKVTIDKEPSNDPNDNAVFLETEVTTKKTFCPGSSYLYSACIFWKTIAQRLPH